MSFYSPIDRLAQNLPRPKGTGSEFMTELSKMPGYKAQEAEDRGLQALVNLPKMERAQFMEALKAKRPVVPETRMLSTPQHEEYTLPGGENYREMLLRHPQGEFKGVPQHFNGLPNALASLRVKDRTGPNGEKILHIEELQSDWHQQGREKGYTSPDAAKRVKDAERAHRELKKQLEEAKQSAAYAEAGLSDPTTKRMRDLNPEIIQRLEAAKIRHNDSIMALMPQVMKAEAEHQDLLHQSKNTVPDAPFKKSWHEMALKKMIHHAATNGYDSIAITPGAEQADRYGLARHISGMSYQPDDQHFHAFDPKGDIAIREYGASPERVSQLVGKELTQKLLTAPKQNGIHILQGDDLQVGGEGMKGFYDRIVPNFLNQFGKKYGAKVGTVDIKTPSHDVPANNGEIAAAMGYSWDDFVNLPDREQLEQQYWKNQRAKTTPVHHFPITPEMREDVTKNGVPLYAEGGPVPPLRPLNPQLAAAREHMAQQSALHKAYNEAMKNVYTNQMPTFAQWVASQGKAKGGTVEEMRKAIAGAAKSSGMKAPVVANRDLTTMQDSYESLNDRVRKGAMDMQDMIESMPFKYEPGQHVFTAHSARKNLPPFQIVRKALHGNDPVREDHPKLGAGMGKPVKDPVTGKTMRTPYEPGYHVRREVDGETQEYRIPESAILGHLKAGGAVKPVGYTKEQVTVSPNLDAMRYELESVKHYTKKVK